MAYRNGVKASRPLAFVVLAFVVGATISQASFAFADDSSTNPFRAIWDAISELQNKTDSLQAQIDDLKELRGAATTELAAAASRISEPSVAIEISNGQSGQTAIQVVARNAGPENAVGVKLSTYYQTSLFSVNSIQGAECTDQARGIIECYLGTLDIGSEARITIYATPAALGQQAMITTDISSITEDANPANNHAEAVFTTSEAPVVIMPPAAQPDQVPAEQAPAEEQAPQQQPSEGQQQQQQEQQEQPSEEQPTEQSSAPAEQGGEQASAPAAGESSAPPAGEVPSSSEGESSGDAGTETAAGGEESSPPPPPPAPPSGGEATG